MTSDPVSPALAPSVSDAFNPRVYPYLLTPVPAWKDPRLEASPLQRGWALHAQRGCTDDEYCRPEFWKDPMENLLLFVDEKPGECTPWVHQCAYQVLRFHRIGCTRLGVVHVASLDRGYSTPKSEDGTELLCDLGPGELRSESDESGDREELEPVCHVWDTRERFTFGSTFCKCPFPERWEKRTEGAEWLVLHQRIPGHPCLGSPQGMHLFLDSALLHSSELHAVTDVALVNEQKNIRLPSDSYLRPEFSLQPRIWMCLHCRAFFEVPQPYATSITREFVRAYNAQCTVRHELLAAERRANAMLQQTIAAERQQFQDYLDYRTREEHEYHKKLMQELWCREIHVTEPPRSPSESAHLP